MSALSELLRLSKKKNALDIEPVDPYAPENQSPDMLDVEPIVPNNVEQLKPEDLQQLEELSLQQGRSSPSALDQLRSGFSGLGQKIVSGIRSLDPGIPSSPSPEASALPQDSILAQSRQGFQRMGEDLTSALKSGASPQEVAPPAPPIPAPVKAVPSQLPPPAALPEAAAPVQPVSALLGRQPSPLQSLMGQLATPETAQKQMAAASQASNEQALIGRLTEAGQLAGQALGPSRTFAPDLTLARSIVKDSNQPIEHMVAQQQAVDRAVSARQLLSDLEDRQQLSNPKSPISAAMREIMAQIRPELAKTTNFDQLSGSAIKSLEPMIDTIVKMEGVKKTKENDKIVKMAQDLRNTLSGQRGAQSKAISTALQTLQRTQGFDALVSQFQGNYDNATIRHVAEMARSLDGVISRGNPTISGMEKLIPKSLYGDYIKFKEYGTNRNLGAGMGSFVKNMIETNTREQEMAKKQTNDLRKQLIPASKALKEADPELYHEILQGYGLEPYEEDKKAKEEKSDKVTIINKKTGAKRAAPRDLLAKLSGTDWEEAK